jgi:hypothetical protein
MATKPPKTEKPLTEAPAPAKVPEEAKAVTTSENKEPNLLEKAKLIADLAAVWENKELADLITRMPNGSKVLDIFQQAINREMQAVMSGKRVDEEAKQFQILTGQVDAMARSMGGFDQMMRGFMASPLVNVLDLMNAKLGGQPYTGQRPQSQPQPQQPRREAPPIEDNDDTPAPPRGPRGQTPGLGSF